MTDAELRALRERAYGPHADIETDAAAAARLDRLENPDRSLDAVDAGATTDAAEPVRVAGRRHRLLLVAVGAVLVAAISSAVTAIVIDRSRAGSTDDSAIVVATLHPDPGVPFPSQISSARSTLAEGVRYDDYLGVVVVSIPARQVDGSRCLYVLPQLTAGALAGGCGAGPFVANVVVTVTDDMPAELLARHETGTALRFELQGSDVLVEVGDRYGSGVPPHSAR